MITGSNKRNTNCIESVHISEEPEKFVLIIFHNIRLNASVPTDDYCSTVMAPQPTFHQRLLIIQNKCLPFVDALMTSFSI